MKLEELLPEKTKKELNERKKTWPPDNKMIGNKDKKERADVIKK